MDRTSWTGYRQRQGRRIAVLPSSYDQLDLYCTAIDTAGHTPVVLPWDVPAALLVMRELRTSGLLVTGVPADGRDVHPGWYRQPCQPSIQVTDNELDSLELILIGYADSVRMSIFGICLGAQLLWVVRGGRLVQHVQGGEPVDGNPVANRVRLRAGSRARRWVGSNTFESPCTYHQTVEGEPDDLEVVGWITDANADGHPHVFEDPRRNVVGIQGHPERMLDGGPIRSAADPPGSFRILQGWLDACPGRP